MENWSRYLWFKFNQPISQLDSKKSIFTQPKEKFWEILLLIPNWNARHVLTYRLHHPKTHGHLQWLLKLYCCHQLTSNLFFTAMTFRCRHDRFLAYYSQGSSVIGQSLLLIEEVAIALMSSLQKTFFPTSVRSLYTWNTVGTTTCDSRRCKFIALLLYDARKERVGCVMGTML